MLYFLLRIKKFFLHQYKKPLFFKGGTGWNGFKIFPTQFFPEIPHFSLLKRILGQKNGPGIMPRPLDGKLLQNFLW
jgi:hypothetical protein